MLQSILTSSLGCPLLCCYRSALVQQAYDRSRCNTLQQAMPVCYALSVALSVCTNTCLYYQDGLVLLLLLLLLQEARWLPRSEAFVWCCELC